MERFDFLCPCGALIQAGSMEALAAAKEHHGKTAHGLRPEVDQLEREVEHDESTLRKILKTLQAIDARLLRLEGEVFGIPTGVTILQKGEINNMITGVQAGGAAGNFEADPVPSTVPFPDGTLDTWTTDDPTVTLTPSATNPAQVQALVPATSTAKDFGLTVSVQMPGTPPPSPLVNTVRVPIIPAPAPVPAGVQINQV
jgi:hypothetical protein